MLAGFNSKLLTSLLYCSHHGQNSISSWNPVFQWDWLCRKNRMNPQPVLPCGHKHYKIQNMIFLLQISNLYLNCSTQNGQALCWGLQCWSTPLGFEWRSSKTYLPNSYGLTIIFIWPCVCVCLWKPDLTSHAKTRIPLGNNWIFPILFRIITEESDVADARRNRQIRHLVKS